MRKSVPGNAVATKNDKVQFLQIILRIRIEEDINSYN